MRKLPIYILINTSSSISNETLQQFKESLNLLIESLQEDPFALETVYISIITFDSTISRLCSLSPLRTIKIPSITIGKHPSSLGYALVQLSTIIDNEVIKTTSNQYGDWRPLVFILTDNDSSISDTKDIQEFTNKTGRIIICTIIWAANSDIYDNITRVILPIEFLDKPTIISQILWVSEK